MSASFHPCFTWPADPLLKVWRYIDLPRFVRVLQRQELFLPRASLLGDEFEGSTTKPIAQFREHVIANRDVDPKLEMYRGLQEAHLRALFEHEGQLAKSVREHSYVSCWHLNQHESMAMWQLYSNGAQSIALQSNFETLRDELPDYVNVGMVKYIDYETDFIPAGNVYYPLLHKRSSFEHEREIRAIAWLHPEAPDHPEVRERVTTAGLPVPIRLDPLIHKIFVHPQAASWFVDVVNELVNTSGLRISVVQSSLSGSPIW